jgi:DNA-binding transcriptional LysR family regulator
VRPTSEGRAFYASVAPAVASLESAARWLEKADGAPRGRLRVTAPNDLGATFLAGLAVEFTSRYPEVSVDFELTGRTVNLVEEGFDMALRASGRLVDSSLVAKKAGTLETQVFAAPSYIARHGLPESLADLRDHVCVLFRGSDGRAEWRLDGPSGPVELEVRGAVGADDYSFVRSATLAGAGLALMPRIICMQDLEAGRLVRVLPDYELRGAHLFVVHPAGRHVPSKVTAFRDLIVEHFTRLAALEANGRGRRVSARRR